MTFYENIKPIEKPIEADRQGAKRHYGVHPYFTRRPSNVVKKYILHFSKEGDRVLDPFGGSGVTAIEAFLENREGIQNDINPLANFIAKGIADLHKGNVNDYQSALADIKDKCEQLLDEINAADENRLRVIAKSVKLPDDVELPSNSDVPNYRSLFTVKQLVSLAVLKGQIDKIQNKFARNGMLLGWSASLAKLNKTFLSAEGRAESRGGSSIFSIYRYKVAKNPVELPPWETFYERTLNIIDAKREIDKAIEVKQRTKNGWHGKFEVYASDVEELSDDLKNSVDYIFTDPPYGGHISYIDLSILWNSWLGLTPKLSTRKKELIVGGDLHLSEEVYIQRLGDSMSSCIKMLKAKRWLSVVFQHWNINYFKAILTACAEDGAELKAAIPQVGDTIWSMHKKKNKQTVLAGEMILTFYKSGKRIKPTTNKKFNVPEALRDIISHHKSDKLYGEYLFNKLVIDAWNNGAIDALDIAPDEFMSYISENGWNYDEQYHFWVKKQHSDLPLFV